MVAFLAFLERPIFGNGYDGFRVIIEAIIGVNVYSHSNYLDLLCNYGIVGFLIYYFNYFKSIIISIKYKKDALAKLTLYSLIPVMVVEYGQITYFQPIAIAGYMLVFLGASIIAREEKGKIFN